MVTVFVFDESQIVAMERRFGKKDFGKPVVCLGLPDTFDYKSQQLVLKLTAKLEPYLGRPSPKPAKTRLPAMPKSSAAKPTLSPSVSERSSFVSRLLTTVGVVQRKQPSAQ